MATARTPPRRGRGEIRFDGVSFSYPGKDVPAVLQSVIEQVPVPVEETWSEPAA